MVSDRFRRTATFLSDLVRAARIKFVAATFWCLSILRPKLAHIIMDPCHPVAAFLLSLLVLFGSIDRAQKGQVPGIGAKTIEKIDEFLKTGKMQTLVGSRQAVLSVPPLPNGVASTIAGGVEFPFFFAFLIKNSVLLPLLFSRFVCPHLVVDCRGLLFWRVPCTSCSRTLFPCLIFSLSSIPHAPGCLTSTNGRRTSAQSRSCRKTDRPVGRFR